MFYVKQWIMNSKFTMKYFTIIYLILLKIGGFLENKWLQVSLFRLIIIIIIQIISISMYIYFKTFWIWGPIDSSSKTLRRVEYPIIAITLKSTLTYQGPIYRANRCF